MGQCQEGNREHVQEPFYVILIKNVFSKGLEFESTSNVQLFKQISGSVRNLIEFLENNQIRIPSTIVIIQNQINQNPDVVNINVGLILLEEIVQLINKMVFNKPPQYDSDDDFKQEKAQFLDLKTSAINLGSSIYFEQKKLQKSSTHKEKVKLYNFENQSKYLHQNLDQQTLQKLIFIQQKIIQILHDCSEIYIDLMPNIYVMFLRLFYSLSEHLLFVDYDKKMRKLLSFLQEILIKYISNQIQLQKDIQQSLPQVLSEKAKLHKKKAMILKALIKQLKNRDKSIEDICKNIKDRHFLNSTFIYITLLQHCFQFRDLDYNALFESERQQLIIQFLTFFFTHDYFQINQSIQYSYNIFSKLGPFYTQLIKIYIERALELKVFNEFFDTFFVHFDQNIWSKSQKIEELFEYLLSGPNSKRIKDECQMYIIGQMIDITDSISTIRQFQISNNPQSDQIRPRLITRYFTIKRQKQVEQQSNQQNDKKQLSGDVTILPTIIKCLSFLIREIGNTEFLIVQIFKNAHTLFQLFLYSIHDNFQKLADSLRDLFQNINQLLNRDLLLAIDFVQLLVLFIRNLILNEFKNSQSDNNKLNLLSISINSLMDLSLTIQFRVDDDVSDSNRSTIYFGEDFIISLQEINSLPDFQIQKKVSQLILQIVSNINFFTENSFALFLVGELEVQVENIEQRGRVNCESLALFFGIIAKQFEQKLNNPFNTILISMMNLLRDLICSTNKNYQAKMFMIIYFYGILLLFKNIAKTTSYRYESLQKILNFEDITQITSQIIDEWVNAADKGQVIKCLNRIQQMDKWLIEIKNILNIQIEWNFENQYQRYDERIKGETKELFSNRLIDLKDVIIPKNNNSSISEFISEQQAKTNSSLQTEEAEDFEHLLMRAQKVTAKFQVMIGNTTYNQQSN